MHFIGTHYRRPVFFAFLYRESYELIDRNIWNLVSGEISDNPATCE